MQHVYDVEADVYRRDRNDRTGLWENESLTVVANGSVLSAIKKATRAFLSQRRETYRLTAESECGRWVNYIPRKVRITSIKQVREVAH